MSLENKRLKNRMDALLNKDDVNNQELNYPISKLELEITNLKQQLGEEKNKTEFVEKKYETIKKEKEALEKGMEILTKKVNVLEVKLRNSEQYIGALEHLSAEADKIIVSLSSENDLVKKKLEETELKFEKIKSEFIDYQTVYQISDEDKKELLGAVGQIGKLRAKYADNKESKLNLKETRKKKHLKIDRNVEAGSDQVMNKEINMGNMHDENPYVNIENKNEMYPENMVSKISEYAGGITQSSDAVVDDVSKSLVMVKQEIPFSITL